MPTDGDPSAFDRVRKFPVAVCWLTGRPSPCPLRDPGAARAAFVVDFPYTMTAVALTIAGSDSSGGAGIQADLKTFAALGVYGTSAITAATAQSTIGVAAAVTAISADMVTAQIEAAAGDTDIHATKTGMLADAAIVEAVAAAIKEM